MMRGGGSRLRWRSGGDGVAWFDRSQWLGYGGVLAYLGVG